MKEITRGGKREGAGRKATGKKKITVNIYVDREYVFKFGNIEKMKSSLYQYIADFGKQPDSKPQPAQETKVTPVEPPFQPYQQKMPANGFISVPVLMAKYFQRKKDCLSEEEWHSLLIEIENDAHISSKQKQLLKNQNQ